MAFVRWGVRTFAVCVCVCVHACARARRGTAEWNNKTFARMSNFEFGFRRATRAAISAWRVIWDVFGQKSDSLRTPHPTPPRRGRPHENVSRLLQAATGVRGMCQGTMHQHRPRLSKLTTEGAAATSTLSVRQQSDGNHVRMTCDEKCFRSRKSILSA